MADGRIDLDRKQRLADKLRPNRYKLDERFVLRDGKRHPFAVICPGGAYQVVCSYIEGAPIARMLNELGISAFIVYYRVREKARYPHPQDDLARAVREILEREEEYRVDPDNWSVWGCSAGGHLAASFGTENMGFPRYGLPKPSAIVLSYPVISMRPELTHLQTRDNLLGKHATAAMERFASVDENVTADYPPAYLWCGDADATVDPENSRRLAAALDRAGVPFLCEIFPGVEHGVGPGSGTAAGGWIAQALAFWQEHRKTTDRRIVG
ncbi:MAG: alpha/beta hydrolase [Clostridia bacterium]